VSLNSSVVELENPGTKLCNIIKLMHKSENKNQ